ncbi:MAG: Rho termination factor N-terminal domain-containing protein [Oscillospiraceae bacterium]|nr:Rho termination factor N-terminal domain-containing protein [Oscillospiraceae bacterium]
MTKAQLLEICSLRGVEGVSSGTLKADIIAAILAEQSGGSG